MLTINSYDYAQSAKALFLHDHEARQLSQALADEHDSFDLRATKLAGFRSSDVIGRAITRIKLGSHSEAHHFLPALHAHQLALWFEGR